MKNDRLSDALRRGDPAEGQPEAQTAEARKNALLARCAAEPLTHPARLQQPTRPRKTRWTLPALAGTGALTAAALYGAMAWFGASNMASQTAPAQVARTSTRPSTTPAPRKSAMVPTPQPAASDEAIVQAVEPKKTKTRRDTNVAASAPAVHATKHTVFVRSLPQNNALSPAEAIVRASRKKNGKEPRFIAVVPKAQAAPAPRDIVEPVVERVIIEQDATPAEPTPPITSVAITMNGRAESVIVSRAVEPTTN